MKKRGVLETIEEIFLENSIASKKIKKELISVYNAIANKNGVEYKIVDLQNFIKSIENVKKTLSKLGAQSLILSLPEMNKSILNVTKKIEEILNAIKSQRTELGKEYYSQSELLTMYRPAILNVVHRAQKKTKLPVKHEKYSSKIDPIVNQIIDDMKAIGIDANFSDTQTESLATMVKNGLNELSRQNSPKYENQKIAKIVKRLRKKL